MMDMFMLLLAFVLGIVAYAIAIRFIPGMQPGEEKINSLLAALTANTVATNNATQATRVAAEVAPSQAAIDTATIAAAAQVLRMQAAAQAAGAPPLDANGAPLMPAASGLPAYPHVEVIGGINFMLKAPISPSWKPSQAAWVFGHFPGVFVGDPSNGDLVVPPQPLRSAAGYPYRYALGAGNAMIGTPGIVYAEDTYNTDAEVAAAIAVTPVVLP